MTTRREFFTQKIREVMYRTVEVYHPNIGTERYVRKCIDPKIFQLESTAPRNPGANVTFTGANFEYGLPEQNDSTISAEIQFGKVGRIFKQKLKQITGDGRQLPGEVIIREFIKGQTGPVFVLRLYINTVTMRPDGCAILATQDDPSDRGVSEIYTTSRFPGLAESL